MSWQKNGRTNPYEPPGAGPIKGRQSPTTDWCSFFFILSILILFFFGPILGAWLGKILKG